MYKKVFFIITTLVQQVVIHATPLKQSESQKFLKRETFESEWKEFELNKWKQLIPEVEKLQFFHQCYIEHPKKHAFIHFSPFCDAFIKHDNKIITDPIAEEYFLELAYNVLHKPMLKQLMDQELISKTPLSSNAIFLDKLRKNRDLCDNTIKALYPVEYSPITIHELLDQIAQFQ